MAGTPIEGGSGGATGEGLTPAELEELNQAFEEAIVANGIVASQMVMSQLIKSIQEMQRIVRESEDG